MEYGYTFKTYIAGGREHYEYSADALAWLERSELENSGRPVVIKKTSRFRKAFCLCCIWTRANLIR